MRVHATLLTLLWLAPLPAAQPDQAASGRWTIESDVSYGPYQQNVLDIMMPKETSREKRPGVIVIHGGGWVNGNKESQLPLCERYLERGFVCASVGYRLAGVATAPAAITDVLEATRWFFNNARRYRVDKKRIVVTGSSAGGHLALMTGLVNKKAKLGPRSRVRAVINFCGITDVGDQVDGPNMRKYAAAWVPEQDARYELSRRVSPMTYVRRNVPPILTIHGDADQTVPYEQGVRLTRAIRDAGGAAELIAIPNGGHGFPREVLDGVYEREIWPFLKKHGVLK